MRRGVALAPVTYLDGGGHRTVVRLVLIPELAVRFLQVEFDIEGQADLGRVVSHERHDSRPEPVAALDGVCEQLGVHVRERLEYLGKGFSGAPRPRRMPANGLAPADAAGVGGGGVDDGDSPPTCNRSTI